MTSTPKLRAQLALVSGRSACLPPRPAVAYLRLVRPMRRAFLPLLLVCPIVIGASEPDFVELRIRGLIDLNAKTNGICEVHHARMDRPLVPVAFGMPPPPSQ